jgi:hypothetical protein
MPTLLIIIIKIIKIFYAHMTTYDNEPQILEVQKYSLKTCLEMLWVMYANVFSKCFLYSKTKIHF